MKSARGIYYDLKESIYTFNLNVNGENIILYFSSPFNVERYKRQLTSYIHDQNLKLSTLYKIDIDATKLLMITLYKKIEKRGFRVLINENEVIENNLTLIIV